MRYAAGHLAHGSKPCDMQHSVAVTLRALTLLVEGGLRFPVYGQVVNEAHVARRLFTLDLADRQQYRKEATVFASSRHFAADPHDVRLSGAKVALQMRIMLLGVR